MEPERDTHASTLPLLDSRILAAFADADVGMALVSVDGHLLHVNPAFCRLTGRSAEDLAGRPVLAVTHPDDEAPSRTLTAQLLQGHTRAFTQEKRYLRPDGSIAHAHLTVTCVCDEQQRPLFFFALAHDVSARTLAERAREEAEQALRRRDRILEAVADATGTLLERPFADCIDEVLAGLGRSAGVSRAHIYRNRCEDGRWFGRLLHEWCSPGTRGWLGSPGYERIDMEKIGIGRWLERWLAGDVVASPTAELPPPERDALRAEGALSFAGVPIVAAGSYWGSIGFSDNEQARSWDAGELDALHAAASAIGAALGRDEAARELAEREEMLRRAQRLEAVGRLAGGVAHDFNNLLTAISGYAELAGDLLEPGAPGRAELAEIQRAAQRAGSLTSHLLAFSRGQILAPRVVELNAVIGETLSLVRRVIGEDVTVGLELDPESTRVRVDPGRLQHALINLAVNAREAMPTGGTLFFMTGRDDAGRATLTVRDSGAGIDAAILDSIFDPFFTTKPGGSGLGLSMVYGFVRQSGGEITASSRPGDGSSFRIVFPAVEEPLASPEPAPAALRPAAAATVLVAEDEPTVRALVVTMLERAGYDVLEAADGVEALALAAGCGPLHALVSDVVMPRLGGHALASALRERQPRLSVVLVSGYAGDADLGEQASAPGTALLTKPFTERQLLEALEGPSGGARGLALAG